MDFAVSDVFSLSLPNVHGKPQERSTERESLSFTAGPISFQGELTGMIAAGRSDGGVSFWRSKERRIKFTNSVHKENILQTRGESHIGAVTALGYSNHPSVTFGRSGLLFTGSNDRTIKVWDVWADKAVFETCVCTLVGHGATVSAIVDSRKGYIVSSSYAGSVKVWRPQEEYAPHSSSKLVYFLCSQTIVVGADLGLTSIAVSFPVSSRNEWEMFVGDSIGNITYFQENSSQREPLKLARKWNHIHNLMISDLLYIQQHAFLVSVSFDCTVRVTTLPLIAFIFTLSHLSLAHL